MLKDTVRGALVASAVAALFSAGAKADDHGNKKAGAKDPVRCAGINGCKGQGKCAGAGNGCAGQNGCKGKGWIPVKDEKTCTSKGGTVAK